MDNNNFYRGLLFAAVMSAFLCLLIGVAQIAFGSSDANPCGNHGNHCCTNDGGETYDSVEATCDAFCSSTAEAVVTATSACAAQCSDAIVEANNFATQTCLNVCADTECAEWKIKRNQKGQVKKKTCLRFYKQVAP